jgi:hypothetical protein
VERRIERRVRKLGVFLNAPKRLVLFNEGPFLVRVEAIGVREVLKMKQPFHQASVQNPTVLVRITVVKREDALRHRDRASDKIAANGIAVSPAHSRKLEEHGTGNTIQRSERVGVLSYRVVFPNGNSSV